LLLFLLSLASLFLAGGPALMFVVNWMRYRTPSLATEPLPPVSILIPARNEERSIGRVLESALQTKGIEFEVIVLDDASTDRTAEIVREFSQQDPRVRLESAPPLPSGWCGKQHACWALSQRARYDLFLFIDADVSLEPTGAARTVSFLQQTQVDLVSGVPRQEFSGFLDRLLIPLIHFVLLGFLPMGRMRKTTDPAVGAACGQLILSTRSGYEKTSGHEQVKQSLHDGLELPRLYRRHGLRTDLFDATSTAVCRMYHSEYETWKGLEKNATAGLGSPALIVPTTIILSMGQILPLLWLILALQCDCTWTLVVAAASLFCAWLPRTLALVSYRQSLLGWVLHPLSVLIFLAIQWSAMVRKLRGLPSVWKSRDYVQSAMVK
jgi:hypothetical protein